MIESRRENRTGYVGIGNHMARNDVTRNDLTGEWVTRSGQIGNGPTPNDLTRSIKIRYDLASK